MEEARAAAVSTPDEVPEDADEITASARNREIDRAALLGAVLAAVVALTFGGQGEWDWLATLSGVALVGIIAAFFRLPSVGVHRHMELAAMSTVVGLAGALVLAAPLQAVLIETPIADECHAAAALDAAQVLDTGRASAGAAAELLREAGTPTTPDAVLAGAAEDRGRLTFGICIGAETSRVLWVPVVVVALVTIAAGEVRMRRRDRRPA